LSFFKNQKDDPIKMNTYFICSENSYKPHSVFFTYSG
jgi:hypothetical protein